jgi:transposase
LRSLAGRIEAATAEAAELEREILAHVRASSGQTSRQRLSRGGDRQLNRALHTIVLHRRQHDPATRDYIARRPVEGKSRREASRLLKRYLARQLFRLLQNQEPLLA